MPSIETTSAGSDSPTEACKQRRPVRRSLSRKGTTGLREIVACPICLDRLECPKMLPCQHSFCLSCLDNCALENGKMRCPQCRGEHILPEDGASGLPVNISLQSVLDLLDSDTASEERCSACQTICTAGQAMTDCSHCSRPFCPLCMDRHLDELKLQLNGMGERMENAKAKLNKRLSTLQDQCTALKEDVRVETERRMVQMVANQKSLVSKLEEALEEEAKGVGRFDQALNTWAERLRKAADEEFDTIDAASDKMTLFMQLHQESSDLLSVISSMEHFKMSFNPQQFKVEVNKVSEVQPEPLGATGGSAQHNRKPKSEDQLKEEKEMDDEHSRYLRSRSFTPKTTLGLGILQRPSGVAVSPWSKEIFVVGMDNHKIFVFESGRLQRSFGRRGPRPGELLCPSGIALSACQQQILVTDKWKHCVHVYARNGKFQRQMGSKGRSPGHFRSPESICVDGNGRIYVSDTCNNRIQVFDQEGAFVMEIGTKTPMEVGSILRPRSMFQEPSGMAVSHDGRHLVVCDSGLHRVHVFCASSGRLLSTFGQKGSARAQFLQPECVALDDRGFILVGDSGNGRVHICRSDGRFVRSFGTKGSGDGHFSWISGIAITDKYEIVVSDFKNHILQVF